MLQLSYSLNAEAPEGRYDINVWNNGLKLSQRFKVEKYGKLHLIFLFLCNANDNHNKNCTFSAVLPKYEVKIKSPDVVNIGQDIIPVEVCAT